MRERGWRRLDEVKGPLSVTVVSVYERDRGLLEYLDGLSVQPGASLEVSAPLGDSIGLKVAGRSVKLPTETARKVWVRPEA